MKKIGIIFFLLCSSVFFYFVWEKNYEKQKEILFHSIEHPEYIPSSTSAKISAFWFTNLKADFYWLKTIQYIWGNAISSDYKKYLFPLIQLINSLNPNFEQPYTTGQLLLPNYNYRYEKLNEQEKNNHIDEAITLWEEAVKKFCDPKKIEQILKEKDLQVLFSNEKYKNPCSKYAAIYQLAYNYFQYKNNPSKAANYYKIVWTIEDSPSWAKTLIPIMEGKWGNSAKAFFMFLDMAKYREPNNKNCQDFSNILQKNIGPFLLTNTLFDEKILEEIQKNQQQFFPQKKEESLEDEWECNNYIQKATRELNIYYLSKKNTSYYQKFGKNANTAEELQKAGILNFIPEDFQQYEDSGIIYFYDTQKKWFSYKMGAKKK